METLLTTQKKIVIQAYRTIARYSTRQITIDDIYNEVNREQYIMRRSEVKHILMVMLEEYTAERIYETS